jgi:hypothetical protein
VGGLARYPGGAVSWQRSDPGGSGRATRACLAGAETGEGDHRQVGP